MSETEHHVPRSHVVIDGVPHQPDRSATFAAMAHGVAPRCGIRLVGELDQATAPTLQTVLDQVQAADRRYVTVNLSEVTFLSAAGLRVLSEADRRLRAADGSLVLTYPSARARRLLQVTGLDTTLTVHPYRDPPDWRAQATPRHAPACPGPRSVPDPCTPGHAVREGANP